MSEEKTIVCTFVGDEGVGKTTLLIDMSTCAFATPGPCLPETLDTPCTIRTITDGTTNTIEMRDTASRTEQQDDARMKAYDGTHIVVLCHDESRRETLRSIEDKWAHEAKNHAHKAALIIMGLKADTCPRDTTERTNLRQDAERVAERIGAVRCLECSALSDEGIKTGMDEMARVARGDNSRERRVKRTGIKKAVSCIVN